MSNPHASLPGVALRRYTAEAIGTGILVFIGAGSIMTDAVSGHALGAVGIALSFFLVIAALVVCFGHLSGAHINPAVTIAMWSIRRFPSRDVMPYVVSQCIGATAGAELLRSILGPVGLNGATVPNVATLPAFAVEFVFSFALFLVIVAVATDQRVPAGVAPLAVGGAVGFCALQGYLTGASMNPARSFGPAVASNIWTVHWLYWVAPITGMLAAAQLYEWLRGASPAIAVPHGVALGVEGPITG